MAGPQGCSQTTANGEHSSGPESQLGDRRSPDQVIVRGYHFWAASAKPIQPALKPHLVACRTWPGQSTRLLALVLEREAPTKRIMNRILARGSTTLTNRQSPQDADRA